ncbi:DUF724 domain-containing protein 6, partial [Mucuna pruriens]
MAPKHKSKRDPAYLEPGSAVEVSIDDEGFCGSWYSGTILCRVGLDRFYLEYNDLITNEHSRNPLREVVCLHQLRPLPPPETHREFKSGDKVDAFHNDGWWEGHVTKYLGNGRFAVYFRISDENMVFPKEQLRAHCQWINHNWVFPIINYKVSVRGKETDNLVVKRQRRDIRDMISELPDSVLLHIMNFMDTKDVVRTCVLSKRWRDLCKCLTNLTFWSPFGCECKKNFRRFVSWVLSNRDDSCSLLNLVIKSWIEAEVLDRVIRYVMSHNIQQLTMLIGLSSSPIFNSLPLIFSCKSLTSLKLCIMHDSSVIVLPKSLHLPALKSLDLGSVNFTATYEDCAEPFSNCHMLDTLFIRNCPLYDDAKVLCISNSTLSSLKITSYNVFIKIQAYKIVLSTPNLSTFTIKGFVSHQLSSSCKLSFLGPVNIGLFLVTSSIIVRWLQVLANVKILTLRSDTLQIILHDLSNPSPMRLQPPCFARLESVKVKNQLHLPDVQINRVLEYLLQNSPKSKARLDIIT